MEAIVKIALIGIAITMMLVFLKGMQSKLTPLIAAAGSVLVLGLILNMASSALDAISELFKVSQMENESIKNVIKIVGVSYIADFSASLCRDMGEASIASKIEMAGKVYIVLLAVPWAAMLIEAVKALGE